jgi:hypothetical protein
VLGPAALAIGQGASEGPALLPDLDQEMPTGLLITRSGPAGHRDWRLGFNSAVSNVGDGPMIVEGRRPAGRKTMDADQVIVRAGAPETVVHRAGSLRYVRSTDHRHWHLLGFEHYELRRSDGTRALVTDRKTGFCLGDRYTVTRTLTSRAPEAVYRSRCGLDHPGLTSIREGISVGYGDDYHANLEGQYLPLNSLPAGRYVLVHRVNVERRLQESSYDNNASSLLLQLRWRKRVPDIRVIAACPDTERCRPAAR